MGVSFVGIIFVVLVLGSALVLGPGLISAVVAHRKGYRPWFWILSLGLVGMVVTLIMPRLGQAVTPEQRERWESRADWAGGSLSAFTFLFMFGFPLLGALVFVGARTTAVTPAVRVPPTVISTK